MNFKKATFQNVEIQRNCGQVITITPIVKNLNRKITLLFHSFSQIKKYIDNLFCTGDIKNIDEAINVYENYNKKIPLEWLVCVCTDILKTLSKLQKSLENFMKQLNYNSIFFCLKNFIKEKMSKKKTRTLS